MDFAIGGVAYVCIIILGGFDSNKDFKLGLTCCNFLQHYGAKNVGNLFFILLLHHYCNILKGKFLLKNSLFNHTTMFKSVIYAKI